MFSKPVNSPRPASADFEPAPSIAPAPTEPPRKAAKTASLLAADLVIEGDLTSQGELHVDGVIRGDVRAPRLSIGESGRVEGAIHAEAVEVRGRVQGSISAKQVRLLATSHVEGDVTHEQLTMETGAHFQGRSLRFERSAPVTAAIAAPVSAEAESQTEAPPQD